jgi:hypothetical protein
MNITMFEVEQKRITNRKLLESFDNIINNIIRNITEFIKERHQLTWLVHILKMDPQQNTKKLVNAWVEHHPRREGQQPQHNLRHSYYRKALIAIGKIDSSSDPSAPFKEWTKNIHR